MIKACLNHYPLPISLIRSNPLKFTSITQCLSFLILTCSFTSVHAVDNPFTVDLKTGENGFFLQEDPFYSDKLKETVQYKLDYTRWQPSSQKDNGHVIIYNHGLQSHRAWFNATAEKLKLLGYTVYAFDRIGSGTSSDAYALDGWYMGMEEWVPFLPFVDVVQRRGHIRDYDQFLTSIDKMKKIALNENPNKKIHLWGNSYGAKIVTNYLLDSERSHNISSSIFTTPGLYRNKEKMPLPFSRVSLFLSKSADQFESPVVPIDNNKGAHWFTSMPTWLDRITNDPLSLRTMTRKMGFQTLAMDKNIAAHEGKNLDFSKSKRFYLMVNDDVMMDNEKMQQHIANNQGNNQVKFYQGGKENKHFLAFTADADTAINDIDQFLLQSK